MAYYSGTASSLADLRAALLTHAQADGWVLTGDVLSKAGVYFKIQVNADNITCLGCESNAAANPAPGVVMIGTVYKFTGQPTRQISFPCNYEVFGFAQELYLVVNYDIDSYQWMAFGKTSVPGIPGQGGWCAATIGNVIPSLILDGFHTTGPVYLAMSNIDTLNPVVSGQLSSCALAGNRSTTVFAATLNVFVNHNLDSHGWNQGPSGAANMLPIGMQSIRELIWQQPSTWNTESTLMPIRFYKERPSFKASMILDCENARHLRIDNLMPGDILIIGSDKWKVFPWYRKDSAARNGTASISSDGNLSQNHTGTFGWAIRYEGP